MVKKNKMPMAPPGLGLIGSMEESKYYIDVNITNADNGYVLTANSNQSRIKLVFTDKDEMLEAVSKFLDASPEEEED